MSTFLYANFVGGTMRVIADITDPDLVQKILEHIEPQPPPIKSAPANQF